MFLILARVIPQLIIIRFKTLIPDVHARNKIPGSNTGIGNCIMDFDL